MRRVLLVLIVLLLPFLAMASGRTIRDGEVSRQGGVADRDAILAFLHPFNTNGPLIADDVNTVAHVYWNGSALVDLMGNAWTMNGTVPQNAAAPSAFTSRSSAGPFSIANYYSLGVGPDVLDFLGDFSACFVIDQHNAPTAGAQGLYENGGAVYRFQFNSSNLLNIICGGVLFGPGITLSRGPHVVCIGRSGAQVVYKTDLGATVTGPANSCPSLADPAASAKLGYSPGGGSFYRGRFYEAWFSTSTPTDALFTAIHRRVFGQLYSTVSRTGLAMNSVRVPGAFFVFETPANTVRVTPDGWLLEVARTNYVLQSDEITPAAGWTLTGVTAGATDVLDYGWGYPTMERFTANAATCDVTRTATFPSSSTLTVSAYLQAPSATNMHLRIDCGASTPSATSCWREEPSGTCTTVITGSVMEAFGGISKDPERMSLTGTCTPAITSAVVGAGPSASGLACTVGDVMTLGGVQLEVGGNVSSYIPTTTTSLIRNADIATIPNPLRDPQHFCVRSTIGPPFDSPWASVNGPTGLFVANSFFAPALSSSIVNFTIYDQSGVSRNCGNATALALRTTHTFRDSMLDPGQIAQSLNGSSLPCTFTGAGTAVMSAQLPTLNLGTVGFNVGSMFIRDTRFYRSGVCQ